MNSLFPSAATAYPSRTNLSEAFEECLDATAEALRTTGDVGPADISRALAAARSAHSERLPADLLDCAARALGRVEEQLAPAIASLGEAVAATLPQAPPYIPFAGKLIAPSVFYENYEAIHKLAKVLLTPVLYAEDTDAIGIGSINPIAASILAEETSAAVQRRLGIKPFITLIRMDYESWTFLCRKHFNL